jgi:hypothetical protein
MDVYVYQAALVCDDCGEAAKEACDANGDENTGDSDDYPQGPVADGGGEADCPQHCDHCGVFLENPLTSDGMEYVREAVERNYAGKGGDGNVIAEWKAFYLD